MHFKNLRNQWCKNVQILLMIWLCQVTQIKKLPLSNLFSSKYINVNIAKIQLKLIITKSKYVQTCSTQFRSSRKYAFNKKYTICISKIITKLGQNEQPMST